MHGSCASSPRGTRGHQSEGSPREGRDHSPAETLLIGNSWSEQCEKHRAQWLASCAQMRTHLRIPEWWETLPFQGEAETHVARSRGLASGTAHTLIGCADRARLGLPLQGGEPSVTPKSNEQFFSDVQRNTLTVG